MEGCSLKDLIFMRHIATRLANLLHGLLNNRGWRVIRIGDDDLALRGRDGTAKREEGCEGGEDRELHDRGFGFVISGTSTWYDYAM